MLLVNSGLNRHTQIQTACRLVQVSTSAHEYQTDIRNCK